MAASTVTPPEPRDSVRITRPLITWTTTDVVHWLRDGMKLAHVADAALEEEVDGAMASNMVRDDWISLGASGLKAAKLAGEMEKMHRSDQRDGSGQRD